MSDIIKQSIRDHGLVDSVLSARRRRSLAGAMQAIDDQNKIRPSAILSNMRNPQVMNWFVSTGTRYRAARAGTAILFASHASTAPSTGPLILRLYQEYPGSGETLIASFQHPQSARMFEEEISIDIIAGSWLTVDIQSSGSASGVSASLVMNVG
jgi:hypothetical protein